MEIIKVLPNDKIIVKFKDEHRYEKETHWNNFKCGTVSNPYDRTVFGVGYLGVGKYETKHDGNNVNKSYSNWNDMLVRCYSEEKKDRFSAYYGIVRYVRNGTIIRISQHGMKKTTIQSKELEYILIKIF